MEETGVVLKIVTPAGGALELPCDGVRLCCPDGAKGKNGGWIGIRRGHEAALLALEPGHVKVRVAGELREIEISGGFALVENNVVTVFTEKTE